MSIAYLKKTEAFYVQHVKTGRFRTIKIIFLLKNTLKTVFLELTEKNDPVAISAFFYFCSKKSLSRRILICLKLQIVRQAIKIKKRFFVNREIRVH